MISHCHTSCLNEFARIAIAGAMRDRIVMQREFITRSIQKRAEGRPFWFEYEAMLPKKNAYQSKPQYRKIARFYLVWTDEKLSPYDVIKDAQNRIESLGM